MPICPPRCDPLTPSLSVSPCGPARGVATQPLSGCHAWPGGEEQAAARDIYRHTSGGVGDTRTLQARCPRTTLPCCVKSTPLLCGPPASTAPGGLTVHQLPCHSAAPGTLYPLRPGKRVVVPVTHRQRGTAQHVGALKRRGAHTLPTACSHSVCRVPCCQACDPCRQTDRGT